MSKHTKGPWSLDVHYETPEHLHSGYHSIRAADGYYGDGKRDTGFEFSAFMKLEDAHLIKAAPEMLEALEAARKLWADYLPPGNSKAMRAMRLVNAAIAKAKGEA